LRKTRRTDRNPFFATHTDIVDDLLNHERLRAFARFVARNSSNESSNSCTISATGSAIRGQTRPAPNSSTGEAGGSIRGIPLSELIFAIIIIKQHLRRYIGGNGLVEASFPQVEGDYVLPMHLQSLHELNTQIGRFFDEALYSLAIGDEKRTRTEGSQVTQSQER